MAAAVGDLARCAAARSHLSLKTIVQIAPSFRSPYTQQIGGSIERQLTKTTTLTATYLRSFGVHQLVTRDSNAYLPGTYQYGSAMLTGVRPNPLGWGAVAASSVAKDERQLVVSALDWLAGCALVYFSLFGIGRLALGQTGWGVALLVLAAGCLADDALAGDFRLSH